MCTKSSANGDARTVRRHDQAALQLSSTGHFVRAGAGGKDGKGHRNNLPAIKAPEPLERSHVKFQSGHGRPALQSRNQRTSRTWDCSTKDIQSMDDLFVHTLRDIYYAEKQIVKALPDMIEKSSDPQLKQGFQTHLRETENHVKRLEQVFQLTGKKPQGVDVRRSTGLSRRPRRSRVKLNPSRSSTLR